MGAARELAIFTWAFFQATIMCRDDVDMPSWIRNQLIEAFDWFKTYLPGPDEKYFQNWFVREHHWDSICWFKASAAHMIKRAWALKALIEEAGRPISVISTCAPGSITYQDKYQIVAHPLRTNLQRFG